MVEAVGVFFGFQMGDQRETQGEGFGGLEAEDHEGLGDGGDLFGQAVEGGIDGLEDFGGQRGVGHDEVGDFGDGHILAAGQFQDPHGDDGQGGKLGGVSDTAGEFLVHFCVLHKSCLIRVS